MKKHWKLCMALSIGASVLSTGCGMMEGYERDDGQAGETRVKIAGGGPAASLFESLSGNTSFSASTLRAQGGIMIYFKAKTSDLRKSIFLQNEWDGQTLILPNGTYFAHAVAFEYPQLRGTTKCAIGFDGLSTTTELKLEGGSKEIKFNLNATTCALNGFSYFNPSLPGSDTWYDDNSQPKFLNVQSCARASFSSLITTSGGPGNCVDSQAGLAKSIRIDYPVYEFKDGKYSEAVGVNYPYSDCAEVDANGSMDPGVRLPVGVLETVPMMVTRISVYTGLGSTKCSASTFRGAYVFYAGVATSSGGLIASHGANGAVVEHGGAFLYSTTSRPSNTVYLKELP